MYLILEENQTQTKITQKFTASVDYNRCRTCPYAISYTLE